jgi:hypothetical protein
MNDVEFDFPDWNEGGREACDATLEWYAANLKQPGLPDDERDHAQACLDALGRYVRSQREEAERQLAKANEGLAELEREHPGIGDYMREQNRRLAMLPEGHVPRGIVPLVHRQAHGREHRPRAGATRRTCRAAARSPGRLGDDPPDESDSSLTPLQRAQLLLLRALVQASEGGRRTYLTFLDIAVIRLAAEVARTTDWDDRP